MKFASYWSGADSAWEVVWELIELDNINAIKLIKVLVTSVKYFSKIKAERFSQLLDKINKLGYKSEVQEIRNILIKQGFFSIID